MLHLRIHANQDGRPGPLPCTFEAVADQLTSLPRLFFEPDGSFVWRETAQWDGEVVDAAGQVQHVELRGSQDRESLSQLLNCLAETLDQLLVESVWQGAFLDAPAFLASMDDVR